MEKFDDEFGDLSGYKILSFEDVSKGFEGNKNPLQGIARKSFEEISFDNKFGAENKCNTKQLGQFYHGQMRIDELIEDLHENSTCEKYFFSFGAYAVNYGFALNKENPAMIKKMMEASYNDFGRSTPYQYQQNQHRKNAKADVYLNMMACYVNTQNPGYSFYLDTASQAIDFKILYVYQDYINLRNFDNNTNSKTDYELDNKYNAIVIAAKDALDFVMLANRSDEEYLKEKIINLFVQETLKVSNQKDIKFLYENMPDFVAKKLLEKLGVDTKNAESSQSGNEEIIWKHLEILSSSMENQGLFSWNINFSGAMLNILKVFGDSKFLFEKFKSNQTLIKTIFKNLEGESVVNGEKCSNKIAFSSFISSLCLHNGMEGLRKIDKAFSFGKYNGVNSDDDLSREENGNEFFLQKEKEVPTIDFLPLESFNEIIPDDDTGAYYHPMDMVLLVDANSKEKYPDIVASILIKAIAEANEEKEREKNIRIGFDILGIALGAIALATSGNPIIISAAIADVIVNTTDAFVQGFDKDIIALEGGEKFLQDWNKIYYSANLATAVVALPDLLKNGMRLIQLARTTGKVKAINFIKACIVKIILEKNIITFTGNTLKEGKAWIRVLDAEEAIKATAFFFNYTNLLRLYDKGVVIVEVAENGKKEFAFIYKNEVILRGVANDRNYKNIVYGFYRDLYHPFKMIEKLEELWKRRRLVMVEDISLLGKPPTKGVKMYLNLLDELGNNAGQITRSPNKSELYYKLVKNGKEIDINCYMKLLDDKYKSNGLPIKDGEHLIYGDFNIPKEITDKYSGLGQIMYEDGLKYFLNAKKYGKVDGTVSVWEKSTAYTDYGGQSINLEQFWKAVDKGMSYEKAAFETFAGKQARKFGFTKVRSNMKDKNFVERDKVIINFLK